MNYQLIWNLCRTFIYLLLGSGRKYVVYICEEMKKNRPKYIVRTIAARPTKWIAEALT